MAWAMLGVMPGREAWIALAVVLLTTVTVAIYKTVVPAVRKHMWEPLRLWRIMVNQGVQGPPFRFLLGNSPELFAFEKTFPDDIPQDGIHYDIGPTVTPQYTLYFPKYGDRFVYQQRTETRLVFRDPEVVKEVLSLKPDSIIRSELEKYVTELIVGKGLLSEVGETWVTARRTLNPFFHQEALKNMVEAMVESALPEVQKWEEKVSQEEGGMADIDVEPGVHDIAGRVIARTVFSSDEQGREVCNLQYELVKVLFQVLMDPKFWIPGSRAHTFHRILNPGRWEKAYVRRWATINSEFFPTEGMKSIRKIESKVHNLLTDVIESRRETVRKGAASSFGNDLLGHMLSAACSPSSEDNMDDHNVPSKKFNLASVFNNCKLFYFAGQDTASNVTIYSMLMMAQHPEWQERARMEVLEVCRPTEAFDASKLQHLRVVGMILNETMRLFPVVSTFSRVVTKDVQLGGLFIPKGMTIEIPVQAMHIDPAQWGKDPMRFDPERFANGVAQAVTHPQAFIPFGFGSKSCIGTNFAMMEMKIVVAMVLRRFQILPSPHYKHHPSMGFSTRPKFGMNLIFKAL